MHPLALKDFTSEGEDDLDQLVQLYLDTLSTILDKHAPVKTRSFVVRPKLPSFNGSVKEAKIAKKRAEKNGVAQGMKATKKSLTLTGTSTYIC